METIIGASGASTGSGAGADVIRDASLATFTRDVLEASRKVPVLVDFWAPWCGPCKQLTPVLEKLVIGFKGAVHLVKVNVDENQSLAQQLRIQSIPTVMAFSDGRPVDGFQGALPESQLKQFIAALVGDQGASPVDEIVAAARDALAAGDAGDTLALLGQVVAAEPGHGEALGLLAQAQVRMGDLGAAEATLAAVPAEAAGHQEVAGARAALALAVETQDAGDTDKLRATVDRDPADLQARFDLAIALMRDGAYEEASEVLLDVIRRDRAWNEEAARKQLLKMFDAFGHTSPFTVAVRRKLSSVLFS